MRLGAETHKGKFWESVHLPYKAGGCGCERQDTNSCQCLEDGCSTGS